MRLQQVAPGVIDNPTNRCLAALKLQLGCGFNDRQYAGIMNPFSSTYICIQDVDEDPLLSVWALSVQFGYLKYCTGLDHSAASPLVL